ncbi:MAG TPA: energy-coupling factor transporter transmembrane component T [Solirubrobacteraceae bacterium]|nr:energy-coupling factor transporter transmembrane component T [Solirubrobacteraceae bacterium]
MRSASLFFYRRLASPLHACRAAVAAVWALALTAAALLLYHPLVLIALALATVIAGMGAGLRAQVARALRAALVLGLLIVLINVLVSRHGLTVFARVGDLGPFGQGDLTLEALLYGVVVALKVLVLILVSTLASLTVDPDELLRALRRLSFRSALTASLSMRMIPLLAADAQRLAEAQRTRPHGFDAGLRGRVLLLGAVVAGSLDRAMDVAATLELRGLAAARHPARRRALPQLGGLRRSRGHVAFSRHDIAFAASALAVPALALTARLAGVASYEAYPLAHAPINLATLGLCAALILAVLLPFCDRRGIAT